MPSSRPESQPPLVAQAALAIARAARWTQPHLATAGRWVGGLLLAATKASGRTLWRGRGLIVDALVRGLWWGSLALALVTCLRVIDSSGAIDVDGAIERFALGVALCAAVTALGRARRIRWAAVALGTAHGAALLLLHTLAQG